VLLTLIDEFVYPCPQSVLVDLIVLSLTIVCICSDPFDLAAVLPLALLLDAVLTNVGADAMLLSSLPFADIFASISPNEGSIAFTLVIDKLA